MKTETKVPCVGSGATVGRPLPTSEMLRLACIYAEQDRAGWLAAHENCRGDPMFDPVIERNTKFLAQLRRYRRRRWGQSLGDQLDKMPTVSVQPSNIAGQPTARTELRIHE